jgi:hypothetical protein
VNDKEGKEEDVATKRQIFRIVKKVFGSKPLTLKSLEEKELEKMRALIN